MFTSKIWLSRIFLPIIAIFILASTLITVNPSYAKGMVKSSGNSGNERDKTSDSDRQSNQKSANSNADNRTQAPQQRVQQDSRRYNYNTPQRPQQEQRSQYGQRTQNDQRTQYGQRTQNGSKTQYGQRTPNDQRSQYDQRTQDDQRSQYDQRTQYGQKNPFGTKSTTPQRSDDITRYNPDLKTRSDNIYRKDTERSNPPSYNSRDNERSAPPKVYRKEYDEIGRIWRDRKERRDTHSDRDRRHNDTHINVYINPFRYRNYCYDYRPEYTFPSIYCFYYDYFPPYVTGSRIVYISSFGHHYIEVPVFINYPDNYYNSDPARRELKYALEDIRSAWIQNDPDKIMPYIRERSTVAIFLRGTYSYSIDWQDYWDMTADAMSNIRTVSFDIEHVSRRQQTGEIVAYAKHTFYNWDGDREVVYVSYTFERISGNWYITESGTSPFKTW